MGLKRKGTAEWEKNTAHDYYRAGLYVVVFQVN